MDYGDVIPASQGPTKKGRLWIWRCQFHNDTTSPGNAVGYPEGRSHCFACKTNASIYDLYVYNKLGRRAVPGQKLSYYNEATGEKTWNDKELARAYAEAFNDPGLSYAQSARSTEPPARRFAPLEQNFLGAVAELAHRQLLLDMPALAYVNARGVDTELPIIGCLRPHTMPAIHALAKDFGDAQLPLRCGLTSRKEGYQDRMHYLLKDSVVVFQIVGPRVSYYQARALTIDSEGRPLRYPRDTRYYCPGGIEKQPLVYGPKNGPLVAGEGFFKGAWALNYGWRVWAPLGVSASKLPTEYLRPLDGQLFVGDRNAPDPKTGLRPGHLLIEDLKVRTELSRINVKFCLPPNGYKENDEWAKTIGYAHADHVLRIALGLAH